jgi:Putative prokaryotic signal transducing protein
MDEDRVVPVTTVASEVEAEMFCGLLRSGGIECGYRVTEATDSALEGFSGDGPHEILVHEDDLPAARALLPDAES